MTKVRLILLSVLFLALAGCKRDGLDLTLDVGPYGDPPEETRKVMLLYEAGFNSLSADISGNISALRGGYLPGKERDDDVILVFSHLTRTRRVYSDETAPVIVRLYAEFGEPRADTLKVWPVGKPIANKEMVTEVFNWVREEFPAASYGAIMSSHATGWLPKGYYNNPKQPPYNDDRGGSNVWYSRRKTFGQEYYYDHDTGSLQTEEIEIKDLAAAIPYRLDYILFDACLMATVEVAWELRNVCDYLAVSPCEIPAAGFNYRTLAGHLLEPEVPDLQAVCEDYFDRYEDDSVYGATITMVDCRRLEPLATTCRTLFERYRPGILSLAGKNVQVYDRVMGDKTFYAFFDLKDMLREAGATDPDLALLQEALDQALVYEAHTKRFIDVKLDRCCGLSTYLPAYSDYRKDIYHGSRVLDSLYNANVAWNKATSLVEFPHL